MQWTVKKFDYTLKKLLDEYWDLADIAYFVDSDKGSDLNAGTSAAPFKTLGKAHSLITTNTGKVVMVNGVFDEILAINKVYRIVGAGGGKGGRALFNGSITLTTNNVVLDNIFWEKKFLHFVPSTSSITLHTYNFVLNGNNTMCIDNFNNYFNSYFSIFTKCIINGNIYLIGNNTTFYNCNIYSNKLYFNGCNNCHTNTSSHTYISGFNNIINVNGQYLNPDNFNFNFLNTSPLFRTGTFNPEAQNYNHVGAGTEGMNHNALSPELDDEEDAAYDNLTKDGSTIYRPDVDENGILTTGVIDMGEQRYRVTIDIENTIESASGVLYRKIQWSEGLTQREGFDYVLQIGNSVDELDTAVELLMEFGKEVSTSGSGANLKGNADPDFDPATVEIALFRYYILKAKFRTVTA